MNGDDRGMYQIILNFCKDLMSSYNLTLDDLIRIAVQEFVMISARTVIDIATEAYKRYKNKGDR